ncbi:MAG: hypothetical protein Q8P19_00300 [bacterium]|nr:hypothetical protein [bacterium]
MKHDKSRKRARRFAPAFNPWVLGVIVGGLVVSSGLAYAVGYSSVFGIDYYAPVLSVVVPQRPVLDKKAYDLKLLQIAHATSTISTTTIAAFYATSSTSTVRALWPARAPYPKAGALLPFNRIVAYYGNFLSKYMGILGEYPQEEVLARLKVAAAEWEAADPATPVVPAIDYIAVTAQAEAGRDGKYRARMSDSQIDHALEMAKEVDGIVILEIQVGLSDLQTEIPLLEKYFSMPQVHLAIDPEFAMQPSGARPGTVIGSVDASDINYAANYLAGLVRAHDLPPKVLVVHRFTEGMVTNYKSITPLPEVQIVMDMDGWGFPAKKINTYNVVIYPEPVQFTGFKIFYKNDLEPPSERLMSPDDLLRLKPQPVFIQYQ